MSNKMNPADMRGCTFQLRNNNRRWLEPIWLEIKTVDFTKANAGNNLGQDTYTIAAVKLERQKLGFRPARAILNETMEVLVQRLEEANACIREAATGLKTGVLDDSHGEWKRNHTKAITYAKENQ